MGARERAAVTARHVQRLGTDHPLVADTALALVLAAPLVIDLARHDEYSGPIHTPDPLGYLLVAVLVLPLGLRRRYPRAVFAVILLDALITLALFYRPTSLGFGLIVATYTVARWCRPASSTIVFFVAQAFAVVVKLRVAAAGIDLNWFDWPLDAVYFGAAWFLGSSIRDRHQYATELERSREALAQRAVADERAHIARELHDAVGHAISVMLLHAGAAEQSLDRDRDALRHALQSVGDVGRAALGEMDHLLGLLHDDDFEPEFLRPSLMNLDQLLTEFELLGLHTDLFITGRPVAVSTALDQSAFRIVQEALTNALKHAGPTEVEVTIAYGRPDLVIQIRDHGANGPPAFAPVDRQRRGVVGMRERAAMLGGEVEVGPCDNLGYLVTVRLPICADGGS